MRQPARWQMLWWLEVLVLGGGAGHEFAVAAPAVGVRVRVAMLKVLR